MSWKGLPGGASSLAIARAAERFAGLTLVVADDPAHAYRLEHEVAFFRTDATLRVLGFPDWETLPYDPFSPHDDIVSQRLATLHQLAPLTRGVLIVPVATLMQRVSPRTFLDGFSLRLQVGARLDAHDYRRRLEQAGYRCADTVNDRGEFAVRGSLVDVFPMGTDTPVRIDLFDDEIEGLRYFDPDTQRTISKVSSLELLPAKEFPLTPEAIATFRRQWHETFDVDVRRCPVYQDVSQGFAPSGIEYFLPLFFEGLDRGLATLFDYLPESCLVVSHAATRSAADRFRHDVDVRYENLRHDLERPILPPGLLYLGAAELNERINRLRHVTLDGDAHAVAFGARALPDLTANPRSRHPAQTLQSFVLESGARVLFCAETSGRREVFGEFLSRAGLRPELIEGFEAFRTGTAQFGLTVAPIECGLWHEDLVLISEALVLGRRAESPEAHFKRTVDADQIVRNLTELHIGAPVVHLDHGVGRYLGLQTLRIEEADHEFLTIEYAEGAKLYVPVASLHLISRYSGADEAAAPLHRLGSDQWEKAKRRAAAKVHDAAAELLDIYARRQARTGVALARPDADYQRFADQFPFETTPDQQSSIDAVIDDLCTPRPMDRLVCGDVGFGKTEVAMRAAFVAAQSGKQVAVLVPTTLLAKQHLDTFRDRFAEWPVTIESVSRLRAESEVASVKERLERGKVDIVIGTHKLIASQFRFKDLGLVIIDEEHRFGVRHKERLRSLRAEVDVLTLTATPIPRTLNMALGGLRDLSIIATAPAKRLSVKTFVQQRRKDLIREAISRELMRGGQVFYLHNEVRTIEQTAADLQELVPEARIGVGHGQMPKRKLEQVMSDFYHRQSNVLVCSTIIESGIDIPNANTIVIERADKFGLAQLHQLRGRVGRSIRQAYAYLLTPHPKALNDEARKRLEAIVAAGELGIGFTIATHDLEIRGAGELLGEEQSGQIESIGFALYMDMLNRAVSAMREGRTADLDVPLTPTHEVNLHTPALIPSDYLPDVHTRLIMYKRLASAADQRELDDLMGEMIDRFGTLPVPLKHLFRITALKLEAADLGIVRLDFGPAGGRVEFRTETRVDPIALVRLVQAEPNTYRLEDATRLKVARALGDLDARFAFAEKLIQRLKPAPERNPVLRKALSA